MGLRRPRTPHYVSKQDTVDETIQKEKKNLRASADDHGYFVSKKNREDSAAGPSKNRPVGDQALARFRNERLERLENPIAAGEQWREIFSGDPTLGQPSPTFSGPWQVSAFALLGVVVVLSAIFLHVVTENSNSDDHHTSYDNYRRRQRHARRMYKTRKKKTDEWSDDEQESHNGGSDQAEVVAVPAAGVPKLYPYYYDQAAASGFVGQDYRQRRTSYSEDTPPRGETTAPGRSTYYHLPVSATYRSPSANIMNDSGVHRRGISPGNSYSSKKSGDKSPGPALLPTASVGGYSSSGTTPSPDHSRRGNNVPLSSRLRVPSTPEGKYIFPSSGLPSSGRPILSLSTAYVTPPINTPFLAGRSRELGARPLNASNFPSFASTVDTDSVAGYSHPDDIRQRGPSVDDPLATSPLHSRDLHQSASTGTQDSHGSQHYLYDTRHDRLLLSPGNYEAETPQIGNVGRRFLSPNDDSATALPFLTSGLQRPERRSSPSLVPFIPALGTSSGINADCSGEARLPLHYAASRPPPSVLLDELRIIQMEIGNSTHWVIKQDISEVQDESSTSFAGDDLGWNLATGADQSTDHHDSDSFSESGSDIPIPSGDPRGGIIHKRDDLTKDTDAYKSLQSNIDFEDLQLQEVIGGGGFGQVWRATWFGTPVAVKILTGSAQNTHIAKSILEEFKAEINLLKGMRHPNICLYMGACVRPPNRAIVTELAANGSVWDALRLPLSPPYAAVDGTARDAWPVDLYVPREHGAPPSDTSTPRISAPIPPRGTWPWQLVKRVASGAARGMAYLHHGHPPVLHRDLKSANLLLDDAYTVKVCDFGLSRLKAQARSMTGNCGTVQWMAPEVLANMDYDEKADVFSYGIILWELLSRECPYEGMTAIQCALAVLNRDKRPDIPKWCPPAFHALIKACVKKDPKERPEFSSIIQTLDAMEAHP